MMRFQMESQQKNWRKTTSTKKKKKKKNEERLFQLLQGNKEKEQENEEKQQWFFLELQKQQEALFKSLSNNQPTDSTTVFTQNAKWNAVETFIYALDEDKTFQAYYRRYEDIYITDCADAKKVWLQLRKLGTVEHNKFVDYILPKKPCELDFLETVKLLSELFSSKMELKLRWN